LDAAAKARSKIHAKDWAEIPQPSETGGGLEREARVLAAAGRKRAGSKSKNAAVSR
jgi:hypothetical protein